MNFEHKLWKQIFDKICILYYCPTFPSSFFSNHSDSLHLKVKHMYDKIKVILKILEMLSC